MDGIKITDTAYSCLYCQFLRRKLARRQRKIHSLIKKHNEMVKQINKAYEDIDTLRVKLDKKIES